MAPLIKELMSVFHYSREQAALHLKKCLMVNFLVLTYCSSRCNTAHIAWSLRFEARSENQSSGSHYLFSSYPKSRCQGLSSEPSKRTVTRAPFHTSTESSPNGGKPNGCTIHRLRPTLLRPRVPLESERDKGASTTSITRLPISAAGISQTFVG